MRKLGIALLVLLFPVFAFAATLTSHLEYGSSGSQVSLLQQLLIDQGFLGGSPTGYFGSITQTAVKNFQSSKGIEATGAVGPQTRTALNGGTASTVNPNQALIDVLIAQVKVLQAKLAELLGHGQTTAAGTPTTIQNYTPSENNSGNSNTTPNYGNSPFSDHFSNGNLSISGNETPSVATQVHVNTDTTVTVPSANGTDSIKLKGNGNITKTGGGTIDVTSLTTAAEDPATFTLPSGVAGEAAVQFGIPGTALSFSQPVTVTIAVSPSNNGDTLSIYRSESATGPWVQTSLVSNTCVVSNGLCSFDTTQASHFVATRLKPTVTITAAPTSLTTGSATTLTWVSANATSCVASGSWSGSKSLTGTQVMSNLSANQTYTITCSAKSKGGNASASASVTVTGAPADTTAPSAPTSLSGTASNQTQVNLTWSASTDNVGVTGYRVFRNGTQVGTPSGLTYSDTGLTASTAYTYTVKAIDAAGNLSAASNSISVTTLAPVPTISISAAPTSVTSGGSATITWSSANATACTASGAWTGTKSTTGSQAFTNLTANQTYTLTCTGTGGSVTQSASVTVTAPVDVTAPSVTITAPSANLAAGTTQTALSVTTNENATCRYSTNSAFSFTGGTLFTTTGNTSHTTTLIGLVNGTSYTYYVKCSDTAGNISGNASVAFSVASPISPTPTPTPSPSPTPTGCTGTANTPGGADPWGGCWPGVDNTGPNAPESSMTAYTGSCTVNTPNVVIDSKVINCSPLVVGDNASGLIIKNSYLKGGVIQDTGSASFTVQDSIIDNAVPRTACSGGTCPSGMYACGDINNGTTDCGVGYQNFTILRTEIMHSNRDAYCEKNCIIQDSYMHGTNLWPDKTDMVHASGVRNEQYLTLRHNSLACDYTGPFPNGEIGCSADMSGYPDFAPIMHDTIDKNLFLENNIGAGFCVYGGGTAGKPFSSDATNATYIVFTNNVFQRGANGKCGAYGAVTDFIAGRTGNVWSGNMYDNGVTLNSDGSTGSVVSPTPTPTPSAFTIGQRVQTTGALNIRSLATITGTLLGTRATGDLGSIIGGPVSADGYVWWNINFDTGVDGWGIQDYLTPSTSPTPTPTPTPTPPPTTSSCALPNYPDATCTGVPTNTTLTTYTGPLDITTANTVIDSKIINGCLTISAPGVIIKNSKITCTNGAYAVDYIGGTGTWVTIQDSTLTCGTNDGTTAIGEEEVNALRNNISSCENGFDVNKNMLIQGNYIHDMHQSSVAHTDGIQMWNTATGVTIDHNRIYSNDGTSAIISSTNTFLGTIIKNNLFAGGAYTLYCVQGGPGGQQVTNNHFSTIFYPTVGGFGPSTDCEDEAAWSGNVIQETGQIVNSNGSIGAVVSPPPPPPPSPSPSPSPTPTTSCSGTANHVAGGPDGTGTCWPGPNNTGVPVGTTLTAYTGPCVITTDNTIIDSKTINCTIEIQAKNVLIKNSKINGQVYINSDAPITQYNLNYSLTLQDSEVNAPQIEEPAVFEGAMTLIRDNIHGGITSVQCGDKAAQCIIQDSWLHGQLMPQGVTWHLGGFHSIGGTNYTITHNTVVCDTPVNDVGGGCSGDIVFIPNGILISHALVKHNLMGANKDGSYCTYTGYKVGYLPTYMVYQDNVFQHGTNGLCGAFGPVDDWYNGTGDTWTNNQWDDGKIVNSDGTTGGLATTLTVSPTPTPTPSPTPPPSDTTPPTITITAPSGQLAAGTTQTSLTATTNESATCAWANSSGMAFASMTTFGSTGGTSHLATVTGLANGTSYTTYVKCKDTTGNISADSSTSYSVASATGGTSVTIGDSTILSGADSGNGNLLLAQSTTLGQTATIQSLSFYVATAAGNLRLGIYDATGPSGGPGALKAQTNSFTPVAGWNTQNVITPVSLPAGTYWLAYLPSSSSLAFKVSSSGTFKYYSFTYGAMPGTFSTTPTSGAGHWSFYATLTTP